MRKWHKRKTWNAYKPLDKGDRSIPVTIEERPDAGKYGRWRVMQNGKPLAATLTIDGALAWIHNHEYKLLTLEDFDEFTEPPAMQSTYKQCPACHNATWHANSMCHHCGHDFDEIPF